MRKEGTQEKRGKDFSYRDWNRKGRTATRIARERKKKRRRGKIYIPADLEPLTRLVLTGLNGGGDRGRDPPSRSRTRVRGETEKEISSEGEDYDGGQSLSDRGVLFGAKPRTLRQEPGRKREERKEMLEGLGGA